MKRVDTHKETEIIRLYTEEKLGAPSIGRRLGVGSTTVYRVLARHRVPTIATGNPNWRACRPQQRRFSDEQELQIAKRYESGEPVTPMALEFGVAISTIREVAKRRGVKMFPGGGRHRRFSIGEIENIISAYRTGMSQERIAVSYHSSQVMISKLIRKHAPELSHRQRSGRHSNLWKGGHKISHGYRFVLVSRDHRFSDMCNSSGYILEHRLILAEKLGRSLESTETVHHTNGNTLDNRLENLQLRRGSHGRGKIFCCADCGSTNIIARPLP